MEHTAQAREGDSRFTGKKDFEVRAIFIEVGILGELNTFMAIKHTILELETELAELEGQLFIVKLAELNTEEFKATELESAFAEAIGSSFVEVEIVIKIELS